MAVTTQLHPVVKDILADIRGEKEACVMSTERYDYWMKKLEKEYPRERNLILYKQLGGSTVKYAQWRAPAAVQLFMLSMRNLKEKPPFKGKLEPIPTEQVLMIDFQVIFEELTKATLEILEKYPEARMSLLHIPQIGKEEFRDYEGTGKSLDIWRCMCALDYINPFAYGRWVFMGVGPCQPYGIK